MFLWTLPTPRLQKRAHTGSLLQTRSLEVALPFVRTQRLVSNFVCAFGRAILEVAGLRHPLLCRLARRCRLRSSWWIASDDGGNTHARCRFRYRRKDPEWVRCREEILLARTVKSNVRAGVRGQMRRVCNTEMEAIVSEIRGGRAVFAPLLQGSLSVRQVQSIAIASKIGRQF